MPSQDLQPVAEQAHRSETSPNTSAELPNEAMVKTSSSQVPVSFAPIVDNSTTSLPITSPVASDDPQIADDVDVIEKEWVDKAKKIVLATKENPYQQEREVSKLQADYLMKRYNKQIKLAE